MDKQQIAAYFDAHAPDWDRHLVRREDVISDILDAAGIGAGDDVLDVACGTGVLFGDYLARGVRSVTAIDLSPEMVRLAREKYPQVTVLCADVESVAFDRSFDRIMVYNALPHFPDPARLIAQLAELLSPGGTLTVAHGMSRVDIDRRHAGSAGAVSCRLIDVDALAAIFARHLQVTDVRSDARMYLVTAKAGQ